MEKHPFEEAASWELHCERQQRRLRQQGEEGGGGEEEEEQGGQQQHERFLKKYHRHHHDDDDDEKDGGGRDTKDTKSGRDKKAVQTRNHPRHKKKIPNPSKDTFHAFMIDAGSQGTRIHIYEFEKRLLYDKAQIRHVLDGYKLSIPTTNSRWTNRLKPGLDGVLLSCGGDSGVCSDAELDEALTKYLSPMLDFVKMVLQEKQHEWHEYPIYLKATGGLRTLRTEDRLRLIQHTRDLLMTKTSLNPFLIHSEHVRVISGEEEAIYGWTAVNFVKGTLVHKSDGKNAAENEYLLNPQFTTGMLEMGGASTQMGLYVNDQDIMANLFKLQIGTARHWNVYVHSFLYFGVNGAWQRLNGHLYYNVESSSNLREDGAPTTTMMNPCLPAGSESTFSSWLHMDLIDRSTTSPRVRFLPRSDPRSTPYSITIHGPDSSEVSAAAAAANEAGSANFQACLALTKELLRLEANKEWVDFSHDGDASFAGVYQPPIPHNSSAINEFIATSNFVDIFVILGLSTLR